MFLANLIERLSETFPKQDYQRRLERYVESNCPENCYDIERLQKRFEHQEFKGLTLWKTFFVKFLHTLKITALKKHNIDLNKAIGYDPVKESVR